MNGDFDGSEYIDEDEMLFSARNPRKISTKGKSAKTKDTFESQHGSRQPQSREPSEVSERTLLADAVKGDVTRKVDLGVLRAYRDLLNETIADIFEPNKDDNSESLPPSQIGASFWTSLEKQSFFTALCSRGPGNLHALASAVGTKSEPEIKAYILLLQEGASELDSRSTQKFGFAEVPAAVEIGEDFLEMEEAFASAIEGRTRAAEEKLEVERWGAKQWLVDDEAAAAADDVFDHAHAEVGTSVDMETDTAQANDAADGQPSDTASLSSDQLLRPSAFLELSSTIFMNSRDPETNWRTISGEDESSQGPSMRRTAFDDYCNLTVSLTRRLMQASIFQALCRLRASSDERLLPIVNGHDVAGARDILGMKTLGPKYWTEATQRCGVEVYSDSKKWRVDSGRRGTKNGFRLNKAELEAELEGRNQVTDAGPNAQAKVEEHESDDPQFNSDYYTSASCSEHSDDEASALDEAETKTEPGTGSRGRPTTVRKRPLSPASFNRAETRYLESLDLMNSIARENELRTILDMEPLPETRSQKPKLVYKQAEVELRLRDWREAVEYEAPWEQLYSLPRQQDFDEMEMNGARRRKRRRLMGQTSEEAMAGRDKGSLQDVDSNIGSGDEAKVNEGQTGSNKSEEEEEQEEEGEEEQGDQDGEDSAASERS